jgi:hypothetical protein
MRRIKNISILFILLLLFGCIKPYDLKIDSYKENKYVVTGRVTNTEGWQEVEVSLSSPVESPGYIPVSRCPVYILDDKGNTFGLTEFEPGHYHVWIGKEFLLPGRAFKVMVVVSDREILESGFDTMQVGPQLDSVYYSVKDIPTSDPAVNQKVMQFYVDLYAEGNYSQYYKWDIVETWEYEAAHPVEYYYDGSLNEVVPPDYTNKVCWITVPVKNVFTLSTKSLSHNTYNQFPLHAVDGHSSRLAIQYSIMVHQLALSEGAYNYWDQLRINSNEQGGLYEKQPLAIKGNLVNVSHPEKDVLGYFYTASESTGRSFYKDIEGIDMDFNDNCIEDPPGRMGWLEFSPDEYPVYFYFNEQGYLRILTNDCVDCRLFGGTTTKPAFWPN